MHITDILIAAFAGVSAVLAILALGRAASIYKRQTNAQILLECSRRYDEIVATCDKDAWWKRLDDPPPPEGESTTRSVLRYLNLWHLEYYLWREEYFSERVWVTWGKMFAATLRTPLFNREWPRLKPDFVNDREFTDLIEEVRITGRWPQRPKKRFGRH